MATGSSASLLARPTLEAQQAWQQQEQLMQAIMKEEREKYSSEHFNWSEARVFPISSGKAYMQLENQLEKIHLIALLVFDEKSGNYANYGLAIRDDRTCQFGPMSPFFKEGIEHFNIPVRKDEKDFVSRGKKELPPCIGWLSNKWLIKLGEEHFKILTKMKEVLLLDKHNFLINGLLKAQGYIVAGNATEVIEITDLLAEEALTDNHGNKQPVVWGAEEEALQKEIEAIEQEIQQERREVCGQNEKEMATLSRVQETYEQQALKSNISLQALIKTKAAVEGGMGIILANLERNQDIEGRKVLVKNLKDLNWQRKALVQKIKVLTEEIKTVKEESLEDRAEESLYFSIQDLPEVENIDDEEERETTAI